MSSGGPLVQGIHKLVLREFLNPRHWRPPENRDFLFQYDQICQLCDQAERLFQREPSVLRLRGAQRSRSSPACRGSCR